MRPAERVLVVGHGYAGKRFTAALDYLRSRGLPVDIAGFCDADASRLPAGRPGFGDLRTALERLSPTVICVTVNESAHGAVFDDLRAYDRALILSEKPLTTNLAEGVRAARSIAHHAFSMNMVERFSPLVAECADWMKLQGPFEVVRVESFWGKRRIGDARPTMGVLSELIHPVDLVRHIFGTEDLTIVGSHALASDFSPHAGGILDSVDVQAVAGDVPVLLHASFAWPSRLRRVSGLLWSAAKGMFHVDLVFDTPHWDCDRLEICSISPEGRWSQVHEMAVGRDDIDPEIRGVAKVTRFIDASVRTWRGTGSPEGLVDARAALDLQRTLDAIERVATRSLVSARYRR